MHHRTRRCAAGASSLREHVTAGRKTDRWETVDLDQRSEARDRVKSIKFSGRTS
jgi:hypothetical protein